jgi:ATP-independent RNA helicase DbpA
VQSSDFSTIELSTEMVSNLNALNYTTMTPIQSKSLPLILQGKDIIAQAKTGSGKTVAFGVGLLSQVQVSRLETQALILCPTRELAEQVSKEIRKLARTMPNFKVVCLSGGVPIAAQLACLASGAHVVVGTPGRVDDHLRRKSLLVDKMHILVLDEADRMLEMGFQDIITQILAVLPERRQTLLFSATYPDSVLSMSKHMQHDPVHIEVVETDEHRLIKELFYSVKTEDKLRILALLLLQEKPEAALVFCNTKQDCKDIAVFLKNKGFSVREIHGDLEQRERSEVLVQFSNRSLSILVATDVAARGIDIKDLPLVVNFSLSKDPHIHVHRVGRTGRAGKEGLALSLYSEQEAYRMQKIAEYQKTKIEKGFIKTESALSERPSYPPMQTLFLQAGRKNKLRAGDVLGALTAEGGLSSQEVGKIDLFDFHTYVAVKRSVATKALDLLLYGKMKGRSIKARFV